MLRSLSGYVRSCSVFSSGCFVLNFGRHDLGEGGVENVHGLVDLLLADDQRAQALDHLAVVAAGLDDQTALEGLGADGGGGVTVRAADAYHHSATLDEQGVGTMAADDLLHALADQRALGLDGVGEFAAGPEMFQRGGSGDKGVVVATECAVVFTRFPLVQLPAQDHHGKGQTEAAEGLGKGDDVGLDAHFLEAEESAGTAAAGLDVIDDQQHVVLAAQLLQLAHPVSGGGVQAAFALDDFNDDRGGLVHAAARVAEQLVHHRDGVDLVAEVVGIGHAADVGQGHAGGTTVMLVAGGRQGADGAAVEPVGEADDVAAPGDLARQFQRRFHRVGTGRAGELHHMIAQPAWLQDHPMEGLEKALLGFGVHVQTMGQAIAVQILDQRLLDDRVVVPVVEGAGTGEEVDIGLAFGGDQLGATRLLEDHREGTAVAANTGLVLFQLFEDVHADSWVLSESVESAEGGKGPARYSTSSSCWPSKCSARLNSTRVSASTSRVLKALANSASEAVLPGEMVVSSQRTPSAAQRLISASSMFSARP